MSFVNWNAKEEITHNAKLVPLLFVEPFFNRCVIQSEYSSIGLHLCATFVWTGAIAKRASESASAKVKVRKTKLMLSMQFIQCDIGWTSGGIYLLGDGGRSSVFSDHRCSNLYYIRRLRWAIYPFTHDAICSKGKCRVFVFFFV